MSDSEYMLWPEVLERSHYCRSQIYRRVMKGEFPSPIQLGPKKNVFVRSEVEDWLSGRPRLVDTNGRGVKK